MKARLVHSAFAIALSMFVCGAAAAAEAVAGWAPDEALIAQIETQVQALFAEGGFTDPSNSPANQSGSLDQYDRYYAGETVNGEQVVVGALVSSYPERHQIHVVTMKELPRIYGGGCEVIHIWFHIETKKIERVCNFRQ